MLTEQIITKDLKDYPQFKRLYFSAFPRAERIPLRHLLMPKGKNTSLIACYDGETFCGFYATLTFEDITHVLFLATPDTMRSRGYGSQILLMISKKYPGNRIILDIEAEDPIAENNAQRIRRKAFYIRNGYSESEIFYRWRGVSYQILVTNGTITEAEFDAFWENLKDKRKSV